MRGRPRAVPRRPGRLRLGAKRRAPPAAACAADQPRDIGGSLTIVGRNFAPDRQGKAHIPPWRCPRSARPASRVVRRHPTREVGGAARPRDGRPGRRRRDRVGRGRRSATAELGGQGDRVPLLQADHARRRGRSSRGRRRRSRPRPLGSRRGTAAGLRSRRRTGRPRGASPRRGARPAGRGERARPSRRRRVVREGELECVHDLDGFTATPQPAARDPGVASFG